MAIVAPYPIGFETGDASEIFAIGAGSIQQTTVISGAYSLKPGITATILSTGHNLSAWALRFRVFWIGGNQDIAPLIDFRDSSNASIFTLNTTASRTLEVTEVASIGLTTTAGTTIFIEDDWVYTIRIAFNAAAGGLVRVWLSPPQPYGTLEIDTTHSSTANNLSRIQMTNPSGGFDVYLDDFLLLDTATRPPLGRCIARQGKWGTPNTDSWTKTPSTEKIAHVWSSTPLDATMNAADAGDGTAQTMLVSPFTRGGPLKDQEAATDAASDPVQGGTNTSSEANQAAGQSFTSGLTGALLRIRVKLVTTGSPTDDLTLEILSGSMTGTLLGTSATVAATDISTTAMSAYFEFPAGIILSNATAYYLRLTRSGARSTSDYVSVRRNTASTIENAGSYTRSDNTWSSESANDWHFTIYLEGPNTVDGSPATPDKLTTLSTINAAKVVVVAKRSGGGASTHQIRRRLSGANTDTTITLTTSDAVYHDGPWTALVDALDTAEIGAIRTGGGQTMTVEECWLMVDYYTPAQIQSASLQDGQVTVDLRYEDGTNNITHIVATNQTAQAAEWRVISGGVDDTLTISAGASAEVIALPTPVQDVDGLETTLGFA